PVARISRSVYVGLLAEAAIARAVVADRAQEVDLAQVGAERLDEVELAVRALPQQEVAETLLARCADHEVRILLPARVEVRADELRRQRRGEVVEGSAALAVLLDHLPHGVDDLVAAP